MKDGIKLYEVEGSAIDNAWIAKNRANLDQHVIDDMRSNGYIPVLDMGAEFTSNFDHEQETFVFKIGIWGYHVGTDKSNEWMGVFFNDGVLVSMDTKRVALCDAEGF